jgi:hypothetical protein
MVTSHNLVNKQPQVTLRNEILLESNKYLPKQKVHNLLDIPRYDNNYLTDSKIDLAFMDTFNIPDDLGERMARHDRNTIIEQHANDPIAKEKHLLRQRNYSNIDYVKEKRTIYQRSPEFLERSRIRMNEHNKRSKEIDKENADELFNNFLDSLNTD